jgi:hypothetical protein
MKDIISMNQEKMPKFVYSSQLETNVPVWHIKMMTDERWKELSEKRKAV